MIRFELFPDDLLPHQRGLRVSDLVIATMQDETCAYTTYVVSEVIAVESDMPTQEVRCFGFETLEGALAAAQAIQGGASDVHAEKVGAVVEDSILKRMGRATR